MLLRSSRPYHTIEKSWKKMDVEMVMMMMMMIHTNDDLGFTNTIYAHTTMRVVTSQLVNSHVIILLLIVWIRMVMVVEFWIISPGDIHPIKLM